LAWHPSHEPLANPIPDPLRALDETKQWWHAWTGR
jgi:hypothetical protein